MEKGATSSSSRRRRKVQGGRYCYSYGRLAAIGLSLVAVFSPLYIDRRQGSFEAAEVEVVPINPSNWWPLMLLVLVVAIALSRYLDESFSRFDPYWIHRVGGSSVGIIVILIVLALVLKCRASVHNWEA